MSAATAIAPEPEKKVARDWETTLDLCALANVARGDRVEIEQIHDRTLDLFERTIRVLDAERNLPEGTVQFPARNAGLRGPERFVPEHEDLRQRFQLAEALGSYAALHDLLDGHSPAFRLSREFKDRVQEAKLSPPEVAALEEYQNQIHQALIHANEYLLENVAAGFNADELHELNNILLEARDRNETVTSILGMHLVAEIEHAVQRLYQLMEKARSVQRSVDGIFLVDSEVMFMPGAELVAIVNTLFKAVGNRYVTEHMDGTVLLAARNLLIQAVSFYSYYGKQQIYNVFRRNSGTISRSVVTHHVRSEIRKLFRACQSENKLVLRRVMNDAEREFEISVEAIRTEAEASAVTAVAYLLPAPPPAPPPEKVTLLKRLAGWLFR